MLGLILELCGTEVEVHTEAHCSHILEGRSVHHTWSTLGSKPSTKRLHCPIQQQQPRKRGCVQLKQGSRRPTSSFFQHNSSVQEVAKRSGPARADVTRPSTNTAFKHTHTLAAKREVLGEEYGVMGWSRRTSSTWTPAAT
ncbi:hypothetical protein VIGAN_UM011100 [Vigna angularis var. angularis]|uniref:Uncharacterized protein n=1 Tax=Vigna angularis var. angularis TaxID=157739 RepID=A0A0S3TD89_PHAAN|nr:hypothetical protein VIGAN_UM011100 [Vigna angularis var. angularis]